LDRKAKITCNESPKAAVRMDTLIQDVLTYSRVSKAEVKTTPVNLAELVEDVIRESRTIQKAGARILVEGPLDKVEGHQAY